jgi:hypothetical protein
MDEVAELRRQVREAHAVIDRVWRALGVSEYGDARGKTIDELVADLRNQVVCPIGLDHCRDLCSAGCCVRCLAARLQHHMARQEEAERELRSLRRGDGGPAPVDNCLYCDLEIEHEDCRSLDRVVREEY